MLYTRSHKQVSLALTLALLFSFLSLVNTFEVATAAESFADPSFTQLWNRTDKQVSDGRASRTFLWGPNPNSVGVQEDYTEAPGGKRLVQYFDKSRMEITNPNGDKNSQYYVTNGLIAKELMTGQLQLGDSKFETREAANIGVAGDSDDTTGPTYKAMGKLTAAASNDTGIPVAGSVDREGNTRFDVGDFGTKYKASYQYFEPSTKHNIAGPFWAFLNQSGPVLNAQGNVVNGRLFEPVFYATGLPVTEAYWASVKVAGQTKDVLVQAFERRILTFTPSNSPAFQVEMGNVGQHYYKWRYNGTAPTPGPGPQPTPAPTTGPSGPIAAVGCLPATSKSDEVQGCVSNLNPRPNSDLIVYARLIVDGKVVSGVPMQTTWYYRNGEVPGCSATAGNDGVASCTRNVGDALLGYRVIIALRFNYNGQEYLGATEFTPK